jgi:uncharacterized protein YxeA
MKKIMIATLGLSLLSGTVVFAQNTASGTDSSSTVKKHKKSKKKSTGSDTTSTATK